MKLQQSICFAPSAERHYVVALVGECDGPPEQDHMSAESDSRQPPLFLLDANACNARQRIGELNELERMAERGVIDLLYTETTWDEARFGSLDRNRKVSNTFFVGLPGDEQNLTSRRAWREAIAQLVFPAGVKTENQRRDVDALLTVKMSGGYFVTRDGGSKAQPGGILGNKQGLADLGIEVLDFTDALALAQDAS